MADGVGPASADEWHDTRKTFSRNAYALMINTAIAGGLGLTYWALAARHYDDADVGRGSAAISAMMLLTGLVSVNVAGTLNRFIPRAGRSTFAVVVWAYLLTSALVAVLAVALVTTLQHWGGEAFGLLREPDTRLWFIAGAVAASVITLQDSVLTGLRAAVWVPLWSGTFGFAKVIVLVLLAGSMPRSGVFFSWILPMIVVMFPANMLIFGRLLPRHRRTARIDVGFSRNQIGRFFAADYVGSLFMFATVFLVPVIVATRVEPHTYAYFFLAWSIAMTMNLLAANLATSMTVEGVYDGSTLQTNCRAALGRALALLLVGAVALSLAAPYAMEVLGPGYLDAAPLLQLLAFASLPGAVVEIYLGTLRARTWRMRIFWVQCLRGVSVLGLVVLLLHHDEWFEGFGDARITAVGVAVLLGQVVVLAAILPEMSRLLGWSSKAADDAAFDSIERSDTPSVDSTVMKTVGVVE